jgi:cystathionine beta-lyase/cystathionine gamma-synthase
VILSEVIYGGTVRFVRQILSRFGVSASFIDTTDIAALSASFKPNTKLVLIETPANPTLVLADIAAIAKICHEHHCPLAVDNTFLTAALQRPLDLGADIVVYSTTKYIEGHNSTIGGAVISNDAELIKTLRFQAKTLGCQQTPFEAWLTLKGVKTLPLRIKQHSDNALTVAQFLEAHPKIEKVYYPFLPSFPQYALAKAQQKSGGGIISFEVKGGTAAGIKLLNNVQLCALAENLGAVETLITHPVSMTHGDVPVADRQKVGITDGLVRLSVGLESPEDIIADLAAALEQC